MSTYNDPIKTFITGTITGYRDDVESVSAPEKKYFYVKWNRANDAVYLSEEGWMHQLECVTPMDENTANTKCAEMRKQGHNTIVIALSSKP
ncbi:MAG: hypothetical protein ACI4MZ_01755 [Christensenellales bacterium]